MCGIFCEIRRSSHSIIEDEQILQRIKNRGPDCFNSTLLCINDITSIYFFGSVLWMQGLNPTQQPVGNERGILLYNGDIFHRTWDSKLSDTEFIMEKLSNSQSAEQIVSEIKMIRGPFSIIYYDKLSHHLFFSRDRIGRNSLLVYSSGSSFVISNVLGRKYPCIEVPATYIYDLEIHANQINLYAWDQNTNIYNTYSVKEWVQNVQEQQVLPDDEFVIKFDTILDLNDKDSVIEQIEHISNNHSDKLTILKILLENTTILNTVTKITELLESSVKVRLETQPNRCKNCIKNEDTIICCHCTTGILFSGGLDCTILAILANKYVPKNQPIDLINVAFRMKTNSYEVPDRITGRQSFEELKHICKSRQWVFREVNIPREKLEHYQSLTIGDLVYPRQTILDESLGSALWFAAGGFEDSDISPCRILLLGSGADELFGGYTRHRNAFKRNGWLGLSRELLLDWKRISFRNLARDNRVICDHGRQPRMPYLDEDLVDYVLKLKPWLKCFPSASLENGVGDKLILRLIALYIGLTQVATLPKRALQFGSRIANNKQRGSDISRTFVDL